MPVSGPIHRLSRAEARRIAVRAQLLDSARPTDLLDLVRHLTLLQVEPTAAVAPSAEVVAWSRLGPRFRRAELEDAVTEGTLVELHSMLRPAEDIALYQAEMAVWPGPGELRDWEVSLRDWVEANDDTRRDILDKLYDEGPLPTSALPDTTLIPWESSGWNNDRNVRMLLDRMVQRGEVATAGYDGRQRLWDLAERVYPDVEPVPYDEAMRIRSERRLQSLGIARSEGDEGAAASPTTSAPSARRRRSRASGAGGGWTRRTSSGGLTGRAALLSPLDRLVFDRKRMDRALRVRLPARDVQAGRQAPLGLLGTADPLRGPAGRKARRHRRPQRGGAPGRRDPRGRRVVARDAGRGRGRAPQSRRVARDSSWVSGDD